MIRHPPKLFEDGDDDEDEDEDMDYEEDTEELEGELESLRNEADTEVPFFETPDFKRFRAGRMSRMAHRDPLPTSSPARPSIVSTPRTNLTRGVDGEASVKSTKSVHFEADISNFESQLSARESLDEDLVSQAISAVSSTDDSSLESSDEDFSAEESDIDSGGESSVSESSELESESDSESEDEELPRKQKSKAIDVFTPQAKGTGKPRTATVARNSVLDCRS